MNGGDLERAIIALHESGASVRHLRRLENVPAAAHLAVTLAFLIVLSSFGKYSIAGVTGMMLYPVVLVALWRVRVFCGIARWWYVLLPVISLGIVNPFFDRETVVEIGSLPVSGGWLSFAVLCGKGVLALIAGRLLYQIVGMRGMAGAFGSLGLPPSIAFAFTLMHRYVLLLAKETLRMRDAHALRSGGRRSLASATWGSFAGLLLLRSADRAKRVHAAAELRGYGRGMAMPPRTRSSFSVGCGWTLVWFMVFAGIRMFDPVGAIGDAVLRVVSSL